MGTPVERRTAPEELETEIDCWREILRVLQGFG